MRKVLATLIIIAALGVGVAYYMGWISFSVDKEKAKADMQKADEKLKEGANKAVELGKEGVDKVKDSLKKKDTTTINDKPADDKKPD